MEDIRIIKVTKNDAEFINRLMNDKSIMERLNEVETSIHIWEVAIREWEKDPDEVNYIIYEDTVSIGWLGVNNLLSQNKQAFIKIIALLPEYQSRGIGKRIISRALEELRQIGCNSVGLYTDNTNIPAQKCYKKCGFEITDTVIRKMTNGKNMNRIKMEVTL
jgi:ribosomal protein S18 acetylase RimI-like enzyme